MLFDQTIIAGRVSLIQSRLRPAPNLGFEPSAGGIYFHAQKMNTAPHW